MCDQEQESLKPGTLKRDLHPPSSPISLWQQLLDFLLASLRMRPPNPNIQERVDWSNILESQAEWVPCDDKSPGVTVLNVKVSFLPHEETTRCGTRPHESAASPLSSSYALDPWRYRLQRSVSGIIRRGLPRGCRRSKR